MDTDLTIAIPDEGDLLWTPAYAVPRTRCAIRACSTGTWNSRRAAGRRGRAKTGNPRYGSGDSEGVAAAAAARVMFPG
jgi:hypothetical protein